MNAWLAPSALLGLASLLVSAAGLFFVMRVDRRQRGADAPAIDVDLVQSVELRGLLELRIGLRNTTNSSWVLERIRLRDRDVSGVLSRDAGVRDSAGGYRLTLEQAQRAAKKGHLDISIRVEPAGAPRTRQSWGDQAHERVFLFPPSSLRSLSIGLSLRSLDAKPRSITIAVKRPVPASTSNEID